MKPCPNCHGTGFEETETGYRYPCPVCGGSGEDPMAPNAEDPVPIREPDD
jgi:DnaJ-class molecular chaperone